MTQDSSDPSERDHEYEEPEGIVRAALEREMQAREATVRELQRAETQPAVAELAASIAHEINTLVQVSGGSTEFWRSNP